MSSAACTRARPASRWLAPTAMRKGPSARISDVESRLAVIGRRVGRHAGEQRDVEVPGAQSTCEDCACAFAQADDDVGSIASEATQGAGHHSCGGARKRSEPNGPNPDRVCVLELALGVLHRLQGSGGVAEEHFAAGSEPDSLAFTDHERAARRSLQHRDSFGDCRLRVPKQLGRGRRQRAGHPPAPAAREDHQTNNQP